ncbi:MAG: sigma-E factor negative regulatory protein [Pseudomonadales bacterium]
MSKGKENLQEALSALMDNEASEFEFRRILKECRSNDDLKLKWQSFHLLSAAIKGELDNSIEAGFLVFNEKTENAVEKRSDFLSRINAELDGIDAKNERASSLTSFSKVAGANSIFNKRIRMFERLGQGAIAASVAVIVLVAGGVLNPLSTEESKRQFAEQLNSESILPTFDDTYMPSEFNFIPQLYTEYSEVELLDEVARIRLRQAVFQDFVGEPQESIELPVNFNVIIKE